MSRRLAKPYAVMTLCHVLSSVIAAPLAAGLLSLHGRGGLAGWQVRLVEQQHVCTTGYSFFGVWFRRSLLVHSI
jgi:hypothetical protein